MIAYCFYRLEKLDYFQKNPQVNTREAKSAVCHALSNAERMERIKRDASDMLSRSLHAALAEHCKGIKPKSFLSGVTEGVVAGFIAPLVWLLIYFILAKADLWQPFVQSIQHMSPTSINSTNTKPDPQSE